MKREVAHTDNAIATIEVGRIVVKVHRASLALGTARFLPHLLRDNTLPTRRPAISQGASSEGATELCAFCLEGVEGADAGDLGVASVLGRMAAVRRNVVVFLIGDHLHAHLDCLLPIVPADKDRRIR